MYGRRLKDASNDDAGIAEAIARTEELRDSEMKERIRQAASIWGSTALQLLEVEPLDPSSRLDPW